MPDCPSCDQPRLDPGAQFCARCGTALTGVAGEGAAAATLPRSSTPRRSQGIPVAVALAALTLGVIVAIALSGASNHGSQRAVAANAARRATRSAPAPAAAGAPTAAAGVPVATPDHRPAPGLRPGAAGVGAHAARYNGGSYSLAYPAGWSVAKSNQPIANYAETMLESRNATAKVTIDHSAGEITDPAVKAAQVEAATRRTPGYSRIDFRPLTIGGRSAFEWVFTLAGAHDPQRADIFVNTGHDGFAFLAHGASWRHASAVARAIAASVDVSR